MKFRGHVLIWGAPDTHNPSFVVNEKNLTKLEEYMTTYIKKVVSNFGDDIFAWDVVNEAITDNKKASDPMKGSPWSPIPDFICKAFKAAHEANPKIELFYNDYKHAPATGDYKIKSDRVFHMIRKLTGKGCPIHGVGFQNHIDITISDTDIEGIRANVARYA
jgi:GH35 family endo-1,4-beta-xylanase